MVFLIRVGHRDCAKLGNDVFVANVTEIQMNGFVAKELSLGQGISMLTQSLVRACAPA